MDLLTQFAFDTLNTSNFIWDWYPCISICTIKSNLIGSCNRLPFEWVLFMNWPAYDYAVIGILYYLFILQNCLTIWHKVTKQAAKYIPTVETNSFFQESYSWFGDNSTNKMLNAVVPHVLAKKSFGGIEEFTQHAVSCHWNCD